jgi:replicative DNA helicase
MGGMVDGNLIVVAGRASMGKSAIAANIATNNAEHGTPTLVHALEMSGCELMLRHLARSANVPVSELQRGRMADANATMRRMLEANAALKNWPLYIDESGGLTIAQIAAKIRRACRKLGIRLVVIDYLQLLNGSNYRGRNRTQEITEITTGLKALAKELNLPIIALSQLSRAVENREDKRPQLSDLLESGSIEQDADVVMFVYRDAYYLERERPDPANAKTYEAWRARLDAAQGKAEVILRQAAAGSDELGFDGATTTFYALADGERT